MKLSRRCSLAVSVLVLLLPCHCLAESPAAANAPGSTYTSRPQNSTGNAPTLKVRSNLVLVDVVVTDKDKAVRGLDRSHFHIFDNGHERPIANFDEHQPPSALAAASAAAAAPVTEQLPPNTYTNAPVYPQTGTLNVLLLDSLNTPSLVANWDVRRQMLEYVSHIPRGTPLAIFTLGSRLQLAQGFTTDMSQLTKALASQKAGPEKSPINNPDADKYEDKMISQFADLGASNEGSVDPVVLMRLLRWQAEDTAAHTDRRVELTLEAMQQLARYLSAIPGRKNIIWFSGSFPITLTPASDDLNNTVIGNLILFQAESTRGYSAEMRQTDELLGSARVAIYPVDAGSLMNLPTNGADYTPNTNLVPQVVPKKGGGTTVVLVNKPDLAMDNRKATEQTFNEHASMYQIAAETGGHAYLNTNDLKGAVAAILENGSSYYTIGFVPDAKTLDGKLHTIKVKIDDAHDQLSYREGYYADQPGKGPAHDLGQANPITAAMELGAPAATQIVFQTRVLPASDPLLQNVKLPEGPAGDKASKLKGPVKRFVVDLAVDPHDLAFTPMSDGTYHDEVFYYVFAYDANGKPVNQLRQGFQVNLTAQQYAQMMAPDGASHVAPHRMAIDLPAGDMTLRIVVYESPSAHVGSLDVPVTVVAR